MGFFSDLWDTYTQNKQKADEAQHASNAQMYNYASNAAQSISDYVEDAITPDVKSDDEKFIDGFGDFVDGFKDWKFHKDHPTLAWWKDQYQGTNEAYAESNRQGVQAEAKVVQGVGTSLYNYGQGAVQGYQEMAREQNRFDTVAEYDGATGKYAPKEGYTQEDVDQAQALLSKASSNFRNETLYPGLMGAGAAVAPPIAAAAFGMQAGEGVYKGAQENADKGAATSLGLGVKSVWLDPFLQTVNDPAFGEKMRQNPAAELTNLIMGGANVALPVLGAYGGISKAVGKGKVREAETPGARPEEAKTASAETTAADQSIIDGFGEWSKGNETPAVPGENIISTGEQQLGKPYRLGGDGTDTTDCGKFTQDVFSQNGVDLGTRRADLQYENLEKEGRTFDNAEELKPGDLVFFKNTYSDNTGYKEITHVGIYAGDGKMLHAGSHGVGYTDLNTDYWQSKIAGYGRPLEGEKGSSLNGPIEGDNTDTNIKNTPAEEENTPQANTEEMEYTKPIGEETAVENKTVIEPTENIDLSNVKAVDTMASKKSIQETTLDLSDIEPEDWYARNGYVGIRGSDDSYRILNPKIYQAIEEKIYGKKVEEQPPSYIDRNLTTRVGEEPSAAMLSNGEQGALVTPTTATGIGNVEPVTRMEINKAVNDLVASRTGLIGNKNYEGVFKVDKDVIRSRNFGDFDVQAHEVGHYLDKQLKVSGHDAELIAAADKIWGGNKIYDKYTPTERRAEGIAEFTRQYLTDPAKAKKNFPGYYKDFTDKLSQDNKLSAKVRDIGDKMQRWFNQSSEARGRGSITYATDDYRTIKEKAETSLQKAFRDVYEEKAPLKALSSEVESIIGKKLKFDEDPYRMARIAEGSATMKAEMLLESKNPQIAIDAINKQYGGKLKYDVTMKGIMDDYKGLSKKYPEYLKNGNFKSWSQALSNLLTARRQIEIQMHEPDYKGPMSKADAAAIEKNAPKELKDITQKCYQYNDNLLSIAEDAGLMSKEMHDALSTKYKNYAPMARDFSDESAMSDFIGGSGKKIGNINSPVKKLTEYGSTNNVIDPLENMIKNTYTVLRSAESNKVAQTFVKLERYADIGKLIEKVDADKPDPDHSIFTVMVNGEKQAYQTTPEIYQALTMYNRGAANAFVNVMAEGVKVLRTGATITPAFMLRNMIKDTLTAAVYSQTGFKPFLGTLKGIKDLTFNKELRAEFNSSGVPLSTLVGLDRRSISGKIKELEGVEFKSSDPKTWLPKFTEGVIEAFQKARYVAELTENATRINEYSRAREQGKSIEEAALMARDVTMDFTRGGKWSRDFNKIFPFFNVAVQAPYRLFEVFKANPARALAASIITVTMPSIITWSLNHDQDWYKQTDEDTKNKNWLFMINGTVWKIPKPQELGLIFGSSFERMLDKWKNDDPNAASGFAAYFRDTYLPSIQPALIEPMFEWFSNYNWFRDKQIVGKKEQQFPDAYQFNNNTSELSKWIGKKTNLSPMKLDNLVSGLFATSGLFTVKQLDYFLKDTNNAPEKKITQYPLAGAFTYDPYQNPQTVQDFYDKLEDMNKDHAVNGKKGVVPPELKKMRKAGELINDLRKENKLLESGKGDPHEKRVKIDANNARILQIAKKTMGK